jgi:hypothetical protein
MMQRGGLRLALLAAMVTSTACALVLDLGDERSFGADVAQGDASDGAIADADTGAVVVADGPVDSSAPRGCADAGHYFCEDFDEPDALGGWVVAADAAPGTVTVTDMATAPSPPFVLHATDKRRTTPHRVQIAKKLPHAWQRTVVAFDVFVVSPAFDASTDALGNGLATLNFYSFFSDASFATQGAALSFGRGSPSAGLLSFGTASGGFQVEGGPPASPFTFPFDRWVHLVFDAVPGSPADGGSIVLDLDHDAGHWRGSLPGIAIGDQSSYVQLEFGSVGYNAPAPDLDISIDNVTVDFVSP